jgi:hypothetical protein
MGPMIGSRLKARMKKNPKWRIGPMRAIPKS